MKKKQGKRHTPEQIIRKLREADAMLAAGKDDRAGLSGVGGERGRRFIAGGISTAG